MIIFIISNATLILQNYYTKIHNTNHNNLSINKQRNCCENLVRWKLLKQYLIGYKTQHNMNSNEATWNQIEQKQMITNTHPPFITSTCKR